MYLSIADAERRAPVTLQIPATTGIRPRGRLGEPSQRAVAASMVSRDRHRGRVR